MDHERQTGARRTANAVCIENELQWLSRCLQMRLEEHASGGSPGVVSALPAPPPLADTSAPYAQVIAALGLGPRERLLLILAYAPHVRPDALDPLLIRNRALDRRFTAFGGLHSGAHSGLLPTGETAMFLLAGMDIATRLSCQHLFGHQHPLYQNNVLRLEGNLHDDPPLSAALRLTAEYRERLTSGGSYHPPASAGFPATRLTTPYDWSDLVLDRTVMDELEDIVSWVRHRELLMEEWGLKKRLKRGYRCLFYGPPGTGKTMTASLLGKQAGLPVYRIDLSRVVSKYIGETEKNLASLFDSAEHRDWILFFDEADSLFGKRTESRNANDRAANQQISYLLQRIEDYHGIVILASNLRSHLDEALARRFQSMIYFAMPSQEQRLRLWEDNFKDKPYRLAGDVDLRALARDHEISGGSILNVLRYACLRAVARPAHTIHVHDLLQGLQRELQKEGRALGMSR